MFRRVAGSRVVGAGEDLRRARFSQGAGVGVFLAAAFISLQLDAARDLDGGARLHVGTTATF